MRTRMMLPQPRGMMGGPPSRQLQPFQGTQPNQFQVSRNPIDPYGHLVVQQSKMQGIFK